MRKMFTGPMQFTPFRPWSDERKKAALDQRTTKAASSVLAHLAKGGAYTAQELHVAIRPVASGLWVALMKLEREGLVWRAYDHEDWRTQHRWKITGCGLLLRCQLTEPEPTRNTRGIVPNLKD